MGGWGAGLSFPARPPPVAFLGRSGCFLLAPGQRWAPILRSEEGRASFQRLARKFTALMTSTQDRKASLIGSVTGI